MNYIEINDSRESFTDYTFSNYKKNQVIQELEKSLLYNKIEESFNWSVELILSGHFNILLDFIFLFYCKYIHIHNPNFPEYFLNLRKNYITISNAYILNPLRMRNNSNIRFLFSELIFILCLSKKSIYLELPKINTQELSIHSISYKFKNNTFYLKSIQLKQDHSELIKIANELVDCIFKKNITDTLYWFQWIIQWEKINKKNKINICNPRKIKNIDDKYEKDVIWFIWYIVIYLCKNEKQKKQILILLNIYVEEFNKSKKHQKIYILNVCFLMLIENYDFDLIIIKEKIEIQAINYLYEEIYNKFLENKIELPIEKKKVDLNINNSIQKMSLVNKIFNAYF